MASAPSLKDQLFALCDKHDLVHIAISVYTSDDGDRWVGAHAQANCGGERICATSDRGEPSECVAEAISKLNAKRIAVVDVPELAAA